MLWCDSSVIKQDHRSSNRNVSAIFAASEWIIIVIFWKVNQNRERFSQFLLRLEDDDFVIIGNQCWTAIAVLDGFYLQLWMELVSDARQTCVLFMLGSSGCSSSPVFKARDIVDCFVARNGQWRRRMQLWTLKKLLPNHRFIWWDWL